MDLLKLRIDAQRKDQRRKAGLMRAWREDWYPGDDSVMSRLISDGENLFVSDTL